MLRKIFVGCCIFLFITFTLLAAIIAIASFKSKGIQPQVHGTVTNAITGEPVPGVSICRKIDLAIFPLTHQGAGQKVYSKAFVSDKEGKFLLPEVPVSPVPILGGVEFDDINLCYFEGKVMLPSEEPQFLKDDNGNEYIRIALYKLEGQPLEPGHKFLPYQFSRSPDLRTAFNSPPLNIDISAIPKVINIEECNQIENTHAKNECLKYFSEFYALEKNDTSLCKYDKANQSACIYYVAMKHNEPDYCKDIKDGFYQGMCIERSYCYKTYERSNLFDDEKANCFKAYADKIGKPEVCDLLDSRDEIDTCYASSGFQENVNTN